MNLFADLSGVDAAAAELATQGWVQLRPILTEAQALALRTAAAGAPFALSVNSGAKSMDLNLQELQSLSDAQSAQMTALIHQGARHGFQYCFDTYRLSDEVESQRLTEGPLFDWFKALNAPPALNFFRRLAGDEQIAFCDAQVTRYRPGHFLTEHDDGVAGKGRVLAYVLNLTPNWRFDWGGLLLFHGAAGQVLGGFTPAFNALNVFRVPRPHSVSLVAPFADGERLSITGWARRAV